MVWTQQNLQKAITYLESSTTVRSAADKMSVSTSSLRKAFLRAGLDSPSSYLGEADEDAEERDEIENTPGRLVNIDFEDEVYEFTTHDGTPLVVSFDDIDDLCVLYGAKPEGLKKTVSEIVKLFVVDKGFSSSVMSEQDIRSILHALDFVHASFPVAPHRVYDNEAEILNALRKKKEQLVLSYKASKDRQEYIAFLEEKVKEQKELVSIVNQVWEHKPQTFIGSKTQCSPNENLMIFLTDLHAGKKVNNYGKLYAAEAFEYNAKVLKERVERICKIIPLIAQDIDHPEMVTIYSLGDLFEALLANMREHQGMEQYNFMIDQAKEVKWAICSVIDTVLDAFPDSAVSYKSHAGNHDRLVKDKAPSTELLVQYFINDALEERYKGASQLTIQGLPAIASILYPNGLNVISTHGHITNWKTESKVNNDVLLYGHKDAKRTLLVEGHFHNFDVLSGNNWRRVTVPSVVGTDHYTYEQLQKSPAPEFLCILSRDNYDQFIGPFDLRHDP